MASSYYTDNDVITFFLWRGECFGRNYYGGSDDDLGFDDKIEINKDDDGKVAKME